MSLPSGWRIQNSTASFCVDQYRLVFDMRRPGLGLQTQLLDGTRHDSLGLAAGSADSVRLDPSPLRLLGVEFEGLPVTLPADCVSDAYVREHDLVVTYEHQETAEHLRWQLEWRVEPLSTLDDEIAVAALRPIAEVRLLISVQTNRLDSRPRLAVTTDVISPSVGSLHDDSATWFANASQTEVLVLMAYPQDVCETRLTEQPSDGDVSSCWSRIWFMGGEHLEKGVIRRYQMACAWCHTEAEAETSQVLLERFLAAPPPLTT